MITRGKELKIDHSRKGRFTILVDEVTGAIVTGTITEGTARYVSEPDRVVGDRTTIDTSRPMVTIIED